MTHIPDDKTRYMVEQMISFGFKHEDIALCLDITDVTLRKHYRHELDVGAPKANAQVANRLFQKAMDGDTTSMIFWLKTRARWKDETNVNIGGQSDNPILNKVIVEFVSAKEKQLEIESNAVLISEGEEI